MEITSENHICNSAENIYDPLTRGKKVEMKARSLIEQRRLGTRRAQPGRPVSRVRRVGVFDFGTERVGYLQKRSGTGTGRDG